LNSPSTHLTKTVLFCCEPEVSSLMPPHPLSQPASYAGTSVNSG